MAQAIRRDVFVVEQGIPEALDQDGLDPQAVHLLAWQDDAPVATGRLLLPESGPAIASRIAVLPGHRDQGLGTRIIESLEQLARSHGAKQMVLHPHAHLERFYQRLGYHKTGDASPAGPHPLIVMEKSLA